MAKLNSDVNQAEMAMERTERKANASVIQAQAELKAKDSEFQRQKDKLQKIEDQLAKTKIYAPADGQVIYATSSKGGHDPVEPLDVGRVVQEREELIYLPTGSLSKADVMVHESHLKKISKGLPAIISIDAVPGKTFYGTVESIAPLPDPRSMFMNPDLKVYTTEIYIDDNDPTLRPGMSCQADIIVQQYKDVFYVPMQAVIRVGSEPTVYIQTGNSFQPRNVKLGLDNSKMIHILEGLKEGELVLLNPPLKSAATGEQAKQPSDDNTNNLQGKISEGLKNAEAAQSSAETGRQKTSDSPDAQKRETMRKKFENMSPEEKVRRLHDGREKQGTEEQRQ